MVRIVHRKKSLVFIWLFLVTLAVNALLFSTAMAAPAADLWMRWQTFTAHSSLAVDHTSWDKLLKTYLVTNHPSGVNRFRYGDVTAVDQKNLASYLAQLQKVKVTFLNQQEQKAYWINLYNSLTVKVILDHYPVQSIRDIDISPGFFSSGPWDAKLLRIEGEKVSLNDIEHRILRPIFNDNRLHYALNCASIGCPNLLPVAYTPSNSEKLLDFGARQYINSPRGAQIIKGRLQVSSIYKWFQADFGQSERGVIRHMLKYARKDLAETLKTHTRNLKFSYDWNLNQP